MRRNCGENTAGADAPEPETERKAERVFLEKSWESAMLRLPCSTRSDVWDEFSRAKQLARTAPGPVACRRASSPGRTQGEKGIIHT